MKLRALTITHYRGIEHLEWKVDAPFVCLVGAGDSTKTTILDALGSVLSSRYNINFTDADFYHCDTSLPIVIEAVIIDLPDELVRESSQGKNQSGIHRDGILEHDPLDNEGVDACLIVRLTVDQNLEPSWEVVRPGDDVGARISASERARLGFFRIGDYADAHLRWSRGSALTSLTTSRTHAEYAIIEAQRQARSAIAGLVDTPLHEAAGIAQAEARRLNSGAFTDLRPGLDPGVGASAASLVLHEGNIPLTSYGLGTKRLTSLAIQENATSERSIVAIDEIEHGLDPHRLLHLTRYLRERASKGEIQVLLTTHAPLVVEGLDTSELFVVKADQGVTSITPVPPELTNKERDTTQGVIRSRPSALLARRVIVGEGATETGLIRFFLTAWDSDRTNADALSAITAGVTVTNGGGDSTAPSRAAALCQLGYPALLLIDGDVASNSNAIAAARAAGVEVVQWSTGNALEDMVAQALPTEGLQELVELAAEETSEEGVRASLAAQFGESSLPKLDVTSWVMKYEAERVRRAIGAAAKGKKADDEKKTESKAWFKREDRGERLGKLVRSYRVSLHNTELSVGIKKVKAFAYQDAAPSKSDLGNDESEDGGGKI